MDSQDEDETRSKAPQQPERLNGTRREAKTSDGSVPLEHTHAFHAAVGRTLLDDPSTQAKLLLAFLQEASRTNDQKELETTHEIGHALIAGIETALRGPRSEFVKRFTLLNAAWLKNTEEN
jgi:hypothetical protein